MTEQEHRTTPDRELLSNRTYKLAFSVAVGLLLATLTMTVVIIIIASGREENREEEFETTLTAVYGDVLLTESALIVAVDTQGAGLPLTVGEYPFAVGPDGVQYSAATDCEGQEAGGVVLNLNGEPTDAYQVYVWGDFMDPQIVLTGEPAGQEVGEWSVIISGVAHRRVWVQLVAGGRYFSGPVEVVFGADDCTLNRAELTFAQIAPLE